MKLILIFIILLVFELLYFKIADRFNIIDKPNERSSHMQITLRGGGIIFYLSILFYAIFYGLYYPYFLLGLSLICIVSLIDDIHSVSSKLRILFHFSAMLLMFYQWRLFDEFPYWYSLVALIFCTGIINAYNFMDGINGLTGGYSLVVAFTLLYINSEIIPFIEPSFLYVLILSLFIFNFFNFRTKAKCFAGDVGSVGIAFILLFALGQLVLKTESLYWIILLAIYGVDSILTIVHRLILHENIFQPHRKHAYQLMVNELHIAHIRVSVLYVCLQLLVNVGAIYFDGDFRWIYWGSVIIIFSVTYYLFKKQLNLLELTPKLSTHD